MNNESELLNQIRHWLKCGCTIKATDPKKMVLEQLPNGVWIGGLTITGHDNE